MRTDASWALGAGSLLPQPLAAVRERLGVGTPPRYTPVWPEDVAVAGQRRGRVS